MIFPDYKKMPYLDQGPFTMSPNVALSEWFKQSPSWNQTNAAPAARPVYDPSLEGVGPAGPAPINYNAVAKFPMERPQPQPLVNEMLKQDEINKRYGPLAPTNWSAAYGGIPTLPTLQASSAGAIGTNLANMPQLHQTLAQIDPQYAKQQDIIGQQLQGLVPADVTSQLQQQMAERGVGTGTQLSPAAMSAYLARFLGTSYGMQQAGMAGAGRLAGEAQSVMSPYMINPAMQQQVDTDRAIYASAPIPSVAAKASQDAIQSASDKYQKMLGDILKPANATPAPLNFGNVNPGVMPMTRDLGLQPSFRDYGGGGYWPQQTMQPQVQQQAQQAVQYGQEQPYVSQDAYTDFFGPSNPYYLSGLPQGSALSGLDVGQDYGGMPESISAPPMDISGPGNQFGFGDYFADTGTFNAGPPPDYSNMLNASPEQDYFGY
jgi:hypothetical protein